MDGEGLLVNLAIALIAAMVGAMVAIRLRQSVIVGYILAGIAIGPFTPGFVGDPEIVDSLAQIGVVFLMFAIGAQITFRDLLRVGTVATIGGTIQVLVLIAVGYAVGTALGWGQLESLFLGAVISNSSSTVLAKVLGERGETDTEHGHIALAWSTVQDLGTIILIVLLSALSTGDGVDGDLLPAIARALIFLAVLLPIGLRVVPFVFERLAATKSREIFLLGVIGLALGTAFLASLFGISLALGAFLAGLIVGESDLSHRVVGEALPFRDLFAGLFFVSVGMLVDPGFVFANLPLALIALALIVVVKGVLSGLITKAFGYPVRTALLTGVILGQSAEFSFLLARLGRDLEVVSPTVFSLMLAGAAGSIVLVGPLHRSVAPLIRAIEARTVVPAQETASLSTEDAGGRRQAVICGYGRVGRLIGQALERRGFGFTVIEEDRRLVERLRAQGRTVIRGTADNRAVLAQADLAHAAVLAVALPDPVATRTVVDLARRAHPRLPIVARAHSTSERDVLRGLGADEVVVGETELGLEMTRFTMRRLGVSAAEVQAVIQGLRR
jgi:CPA2 family monovalent cation:H+ antiporter-2